ncbi:TetR/AcrR family transcriptional regulator [Burkholderia cepacia]|uniref:TetR/AcrR family transcriptional regulator n=1 Tax=Burkholderia cepacia TaxID=292 RepID=UPI001FC810F7|nr:TetR/AcrR family transcriptional regulator [Burkholderia cepacia]
MVDAILEAAARVLAERGWARFTTNEVAAVAGVSVGSLYQYFPNKLSLAEAIRQRHLDTVLGALAVADRSCANTTSDQRITWLIDGVIAVHVVNQALHRVLLDEVPLTSSAQDDTFEQEYQRRYRAVIAASSRNRHRLGNEMAGRVLAAAVEGVVHAAARRGELTSPALKRELVQLVRGYLFSQPKATTSGRAA